MSHHPKSTPGRCFSLSKFDSLDNRMLPYEIDKKQYVR